MKKIIAAAASLLFALAGAFAVKLPDGTNVRAREVTTYESGALRSVDVGGRSGHSREEGEGVEIATPIGTMLVYGKIYYYEDGTVKSVMPCYVALNKTVRVQTNFGTLTVFSDYGTSRITFYQSGALWYIDNGGEIPYEEGRTLPFEEKGQVTDCTFNYHWSSGAMVQPAQKPALAQAMYYPSAHNANAANAQRAIYTGEISRGGYYDTGTLSLFRGGGFLFYDSRRSD